MSDLRVEAGTASLPTLADTVALGERIGRGLRAAPNDQALLNLRREAQLAKQQVQEAQEEQALLEEARRQQAERQQREELQRREMETQQPWWQQPPNYQNNSGFNQR